MNFFDQLEFFIHIRIFHFRLKNYSPSAILDCFRVQLRFLMKLVFDLLYYFETNMMRKYLKKRYI